MQWYWCPRRRPRHRRGLARGGGGAVRGRRRDFLKDLLVSGLQLRDLARDPSLTGGDLLDGFPHVGKISLYALSHRGDIRLYLLYLLRAEGRGRWCLRCDRLWRRLSDGCRFAFDDQRFRPAKLLRSTWLPRARCDRA